MIAPTPHDRVAGGLVGLLVGDALGVPYEFHAPDAIPPSALIDFEPPAGFDRSHRGVPPATWSDDGAQALCLLASLLDRGRLDADDLARRLVRWYDEGYLAVDGIVFDVGIATGTALRALRSGRAADDGAPADAHGNGNGSLMRALPLALWHRGSDESLVHDAHLQSRVTHAHMRSQVCCALYCLWARRILQEDADAWRSAVATLRAIYATTPDATEELEWSIRPDEEHPGTGSGYVVDSLRSARMVQRETTYEAIVRAAVALGRDTDTTACIAGGIAGLRFGLEAIPTRWRDALRGTDIVAPLLDRLLNAVATR